MVYEQVIFLFLETHFLSCIVVNHQKIDLTNFSIFFLFLIQTHRSIRLNKKKKTKNVELSDKY